MIEPQMSDPGRPGHDTDEPAQPPDPDAPGRWAADPEGDAPEPNEPA